MKNRWEQRKLLKGERAWGSKTMAVFASLGGCLEDLLPELLLLEGHDVRLHSVEGDLAAQRPPAEDRGCVVVDF